MEAAVRWSPLSTRDRARFLLADVAGNALTLYGVESLTKGSFKYKPIARREKVNNFTAFDWSKTDDSLVALGLSSGNAELYRFDDSAPSDPVFTFNIKTQRKCNTIAFNTENLLAVGLDRVRHDNCLTVYDVEARDVYSRLCVSEAVTSVRFFPTQPQQILAAVSRQTIRLYDFRDPSTSTTGLGSCGVTKLVNNIAIDPLDENYFASGGSTGDPSVTIWDKRWLSRSGSTTSSMDGKNNGSVLDLRPATDNSQTTSVWSIRYSGLKRGRFCLLSSTGEVKLYDTAHHEAYSKLRPNTSMNYYGGNPWTHPYYVSRTHNLRHPENSARRDNGDSKIVAFDWLSTGDHDHQAMLALHPSRSIDLIYAPNPCHADMTARGDISICRDEFTIFEPRHKCRSVAEEVRNLQKLSNGTVPSQDKQPMTPATNSSANLLDKRNLKALNGSTRVAVTRTKEWLDDGVGRPPGILRNERVVEALALSNVARRRCQEGYLFDPKRNMEIVAEDVALVKLWVTIKRLEALAKDGGMASAFIDLSFLGVGNIWDGSLGNGPNRVISPRNTIPDRFEDVVHGILESHSFPTFVGAQTEKADQRQLCLAMCGWDFTPEQTKERCDYLVKGQRYYEAVATAMFRECKSIALDILRDLIRDKTIQNIGLGALIASDSLNDEQREMCRWMEEDASDAYLRTLLIYLGSGDWLDVVNKLDLDIKLADRLGIAFKHLDDAQVTSFVDQMTRSFITTGNVEGILLTGLTEKAMELFQSYIRRTNDLQTAVLATAFTNPLFVDDARWEMWKETYFMQMQSWRAFIERTKFTMQHTRRSVTRGGHKLIKPPPRQLALRCAHCQRSLAKETDTGVPGSAKNGHTADATRTRIAGPAANAGTACPRCGRHLPRCSLCMQWLGTPEPSRVKETDKESDVLSKFVTFCASCTHGFHAHHARTWFAKYAMCPVPDCRCLCGLK